jgi:hypothetical protein
MTAVGSDTGNSVLQVCNIGPSEPYLDLAKVDGIHEQTSGAPRYPTTRTLFPYLEGLIYHNGGSRLRALRLFGHFWCGEIGDCVQLNIIM